MRQDLKLTLSKAIRSATRSIAICVYGITDPELLSLLHRRSQAGIDLSIDYDPSASAVLEEHLPHALLHPFRSKGLMHRKMLVFDDTHVFLGSANLTPSSLRQHDNLVLGIYHPPLAAFLKDPKDTSFDFVIGNQKAALFLLPDPEQKGWHRLLDAIQSATTHIRIAMFTLTHPEIAEALIQAHERGVHVAVAIDYYTGRGASKQVVQQLQRSGISVSFSQGRELLHYKWAWIDDDQLIMGSANWTKAAFHQNHDFLLFLSSLAPKEQAFMKQLWRIIETENNYPTAL